MLKLVPTSLYNVPAVETWLADQARRGRHALGFCGDHLLRFRKGPPAETVYRLEPQLQRRGTPDRETLDLYAAAGWAYLGAPMRDQFYLWQSTRPDAREVHTDPVAEDLAYGWVSQVQADRVRFWCVWSVLFLLFWLLIARISGSVWRIFLESGRMVLAQVYLLQLPVGLAFSLADFRALRALRRRLSAGVPLDRTARLTWRQRWGRRLVLGAVGLLMACAFGLSLSREAGNLTDLPLPPAGELGVTAPLDAPWGTRDRTLLAASALDAVQMERDTGAVVWSAEVYRLRLPLLAGPVLRGLLRGEPPREAAPPAVLEGTPFDEARYLRDGDGTQYLAARLGGRVLYCEADVPEDLRDHLDTFAAALAEW